MNSPRQHQAVIDSVLDFWFSARVKPLWFNATPEFDQQLRDEYVAVWQQAAAGELDHWCETPRGCLALVIILDQFPLNMFRGEAKSFSTETRARNMARLAIEREWDQVLTDEQKAFLYLPFMHSESVHDQDRSVALYKAAGLSENLQFAEHHRNIIERFGRFPHRNAILGRQSTPAEEQYLQSDEAFEG